MLVQIPPPDSLSGVLREVFAAPEYRWHEAPNPLRVLLIAYERTLDWLFGLRDAHPAAYLVVLGLMLAVLLTIIVHLSYVISRALRPVAPEAAAPRAAAPAPRDVSWHLARSRSLGAEGRYAEALGHRFLALVLDLERRRALRFHPSKTPAEYVAEARLDEAGKSALGALVTTLYGHRFGAVPCTASDWSRFERSAEEVGGHVAAR